MTYHHRAGMLKYVGLSACCFFLFGIFSHAQSVTEGIEKQISEYAQNNPQEKIFVHTDKSFYVPGEIIWFKIYTVDARFHMPVDLSKVVYVEILDKNNMPVLQTKTALKKGSGNGSFLIPVSITSGNFRLRAYTRWMKNWDADFYFEKPVTIINTLKNLSSPAPERLKYDIQFFPEGGNLVNNIESKVAFKVTNQYGNGLDCSGVIINQRNDTLLQFKPLHLGIGNFLFTPKPGENYKAIVNIPKDSSKITVPLPAAYESGYVMRVEDAGNQLQVTVITGSQSSNETVYLVSHTRQKTNSAEGRAVSSGKSIFMVDKSSLPPGITTFTLFNQSRQPVCERLYFKKPGLTGLAVNPDKASYSTRSKVTLDLAGDNSITQNESADMSLSVYRVDSLQSTDNTDIATYLWLTSDLKGSVESPGYYFTHTGEEAEKAADNLMLTHGWRRFKWEDVLSGKKPSFQFIPEYEGHIVTGKIINKKTGLPAENIIGYFSSPAKKFQFTSGTSNAQGLVYFNTKDFTGTEQIIVQTNNKLNADYRIDILNPFSETYPSSLLPALAIQPTMQNQLLSHSINSQVQTTYSNDSLQKFYFPYTDTSHFYGIPDRAYYLDDYTRFTTMEEVLREYVLEVAPRIQSKKFHLYVLKNAHEFFEHDALVLIDGVPYFDMDSVMAVDPLKIKKVEILAKEYYLGPVASDGIISYTTYKGDLDGVRLDPGAVVIEYEGLQLQREFYSPRYETPAQKNSRTPDFRNQLYWVPDVKLSGQSKEQLSFYTSDLEGKYFIMLQGISGNGKIFSTTATFDVKK